MHAVDAFRHTIEQAGLHPPAVIPPGEMIRFPGVGKSNGNTSGWAKLFADGQGGVFGDWASDRSEIWHVARATPMTPAERSARAQRVAEARRIREEEELARHADAAREAQAIWASATEADPSHPYLRRKGIQPHGLGVDNPNHLLVPVMIDGALASLQFIPPEGREKTFLFGGAVKGASFVLGELDGATIVLLSEGFATSASLYEATGHPTVCTFFAGNLRAVAEQVRHEFPTATILVCGDNDVHENGAPNTGLLAATAAAKAIDGLLAIPDLDGRKCDFNDLHVQRGLAAVSAAIEAALHERDEPGDAVRLNGDNKEEVGPVHEARPLEDAVELDSPVAPIASPSLIDEVHTFLGRFVAYPSEHAHVAHTLWVVHTHLMQAWESTPRLAFLSPEPGSGKTRALELTETLVPRPIEAINATPAYLFRKVSDPKGLPTILYDEIDTLFGPKAKEHEEVRGIINAGHRRGASAGRCVVKGKVIETEELPAYCAVALAGIGLLPDTILTRSVVIRMRRRAPTEQVEPYRRRLHAPQGYQLRDRVASWAMEICHRVEVAPTMPSGIMDRDADVWESLLAIADAAGGAWPDTARVAAVTLVTDAKAATPSLGIRLLTDLRTVFGSHDALSTVTILDALIALDESPWGDLRGKPLDSRRLSKFLKPYDIAPKLVRIGSSVCRGYHRTDLHDPWVRYLTPQEETLV